MEGVIVRREIGNLGRVEWMLMRICWNFKDACAKEIYDETLKEKKRSYHSIKSMLDRLVRKGFLVRKKRGNLWFYSPKISDTKAKTRAFIDFVTTALDNQIAPIMMNLLKRKNYQKEYFELKRLIEEFEKGNK